MILLGVVLLIIGFIAKVAILWAIGIIALIVGAGLVLLGAMGRAVGAASTTSRAAGPAIAGATAGGPRRW